jgi:hypothetical protein
LNDERIPVPQRGVKLAAHAVLIKLRLTKVHGLEHDPEKWTPVFRKDHAPTKKL